MSRKDVENEILEWFRKNNHACNNKHNLNYLGFTWSQLKELTELAQQKTAQAIFDDLDRMIEKEKDSGIEYPKLKKKWGCGV
jgi:hypothetical protein